MDRRTKSGHGRDLLAVVLAAQLACGGLACSDADNGDVAIDLPALDALATEMQQRAGDNETLALFVAGDARARPYIEMALRWRATNAADANRIAAALRDGSLDLGKAAAARGAPLGDLDVGGALPRLIDWARQQLRQASKSSTAALTRGGIGKRTRAATLIEYALLVALIAIIVTAGIRTLGPKVACQFAQTAAALDAPAPLDAGSCANDSGSERPGWLADASRDQPSPDSSADGPARDTGADSTRDAGAPDSTRDSSVSDSTRDSTRDVAAADSTRDATADNGSVDAASRDLAVQQDLASLPDLGASRDAPALRDLSTPRDLAAPADGPSTRDLLATAPDL